MHRAHHYPHLIARWRALARRAGMRLHRLATVGAFPLFVLRTPALRKRGGIYLSAGIHGDEPASTEALLAWAEKNAAHLRELPLFLLPCLNPWGLTNNLRTDAEGRDLNRAFHLETVPELVALRALAEPYCFDVALLLHEDYDGEGLYLYETPPASAPWGETLLQAASAVIPIDPRTRVEKRKMVEGLIRRRIDPQFFAKMGYPEAIWLHLKHARRTFTVETPSEFALEQRIRAHVAVIEAALEAREREAAGG